MELKTFGFVGLGLIGGSLAMALKRSDETCRIMACTRSRETSQEAASQGVIDDICTSWKDEKFSDCDCVFLCAPVGENTKALSEISTVVRQDCLLTDVGSVKTDIHQEAEKLGLNGRFIGGHPMTGSEESGFSHAQAHMFENSYYILTPSSGTSDELLEAYRTIVSNIGALPIVLDYREHDYATAAISHLPHLIAAALVNTVHDLDSRDELMKMLAAGGFKDITRIASSSPEMWEQICVSNNENISSVMNVFIRQLEDSRDAMNEGKGQEIYDMFEKSRDYRDSFSSENLGSIKRTYRIYCDIVDESGAIATIATILSVNGINIKNIGIVHNREYEEGVLQIEFYEEAPSKAAAEVLRQHRYQVWER